MEKYKGVTCVQQARGGTWYVKFRDPRRSRRQVMVSTESIETGIAERISRELSSILHGPREQWNKLPGGLHPRTVAIWSPIDREIASTVEVLPDVFEFLKRELHALFPLPEGTTIQLYEKNGKLEAPLHPLYAEHPQYRRIKVIFEKLDEARRQLESVPIITQERYALQLELTRVKDQLRRMGIRAVRDGARKPIKESIEQFFTSGACGARSGWRKSLRNWFNRLAEEVGEDFNVMELTPEQVAAHIHRQDCGAETKRRLRINLCTFLRHATNEVFDERSLKLLTKGLAAQAKLETNSEWFWLTRAQAQGVIENLKSAGQFWQDAAMLQYACGFRAEELPLLQSSNVFENKDTIFVKVSRIFDGRRLVRRLKTDRSEDSVEVPRFALEALHRRLKEKEFLLFPCYDLKSFVAPRFRQDLSTFEIHNKLWPVPALSVADDDDDKGGDAYAFTACYLPVLRRAAKGLEGFDPKKVDCRTFRRTCARELTEKWGHDRAAAVLRDDVEILRKHYADLVASDTSTER